MAAAALTSPKMRMMKTICGCNISKGYLIGSLLKEDRSNRSVVGRGCWLNVCRGCWLISRSRRCWLMVGGGGRCIGGRSIGRGGHWGNIGRGRRCRWLKRISWSAERQVFEGGQIPGRQQALGGMQVAA